MFLQNIKKIIKYINKKLRKTIKIKVEWPEDIKYLMQDNVIHDYKMTTKLKNIIFGKNKEIIVIVVFNYPYEIIKENLIKIETDSKKYLIEWDFFNIDIKTHEEFITYCLLEE